MEALLNDIGEFLASGRGYDVLRALLLLVAGLIIASLLGRGTHRVALKYTDVQRAMLARRIVYYTVLVLTVISVLRELGFNLTVLLGAAGVLSVAIGFASQTAASNLISGLFLIGEKPFVIGDIVTIGTTTGEVLSIDLLSVRLRTFDNLMVRVPNQTLMQSEIVNLTRFPLRRFDLQVGVAYREELERVRQVLLDTAAANPLSLEDPAPLIIFIGYGSSSVDLQLSVWGLRENYLALRNSIALDVKAAFDREGIEIPFPHVSLYAGSESAPLPLDLKRSTR